MNVLREKMVLDFAKRYRDAHPANIPDPSIVYPRRNKRILVLCVVVLVTCIILSLYLLAGKKRSAEWIVLLLAGVTGLAIPGVLLAGLGVTFGRRSYPAKDEIIARIAKDREAAASATSRRRQLGYEVDEIAFILRSEGINEVEATALAHLAIIGSEWHSMPEDSERSSAYIKERPERSEKAGRIHHLMKMPIGSSGGDSYHDDDGFRYALSLTQLISMSRDEFRSKAEYDHRRNPRRGGVEFGYKFTRVAYDRWEESNKVYR